MENGNHDTRNDANVMKDEGKIFHLDFTHIRFILYLVHSFFTLVPLSVQYSVQHNTIELDV